MKFMRFVPALFFASAFLFAADSKPAQVSVDPIATVTAIRGKAAKAEIHLKVGSGFHINSNKPTSDLLIPTSIEFAPNAHIKIGKVEYPAGQDFKIPIAPDEKLSVYAGDVKIVAPLVVARATPPGAYNLKATLTYQACSDNSCFPPKKLALDVPVNVQSASK
jgi:DsbC/DsbD-like thiol-disulfide interchange protein